MRGLTWKLCGVASLLVLAGAAALFLIPETAIVDWAIRMYSPDGIVSAEGHRLIAAILHRGQKVALAAGLAGVLATPILRRAERIMAAIEPTAPPPALTPSRQLLIGLAGLCLVRLLVGWVHVRDSFFEDELFTLSYFARASVPGIFGWHHYTSANNHILNSLFMHVMLGVGATSEWSIRLFPFAASVAAIPATARLGLVMRMPERNVLVACALVACSPVVDYFGAQARGYALTMFFCPLAISYHLECLTSPTRRALVGLWASTAMLALSNIFTLLVVAAEAAQLLFEALWPRSVSRAVGHPRFSQHLFLLVAAAAVALAANALSLPMLVHGSVLFESSTPLTLEVATWLASAPLLPLGNPWVGGVALAIVGYLAVQRRLFAREREIACVAFVVVSGVLSAIVLKKIEPRFLAYLNGPFILVLVVGFSNVMERLLAKREAAVTVAVAAVLALFSLREAIVRAPLQDIRGLVRAADGVAAGRMKWGLGIAGLEYYASDVTMLDYHSTDLPKVPSLFLAFRNLGEEKRPVLKLVMASCVRREEIRSETPMALYDCPPFP